MASLRSDRMRLHVGDDLDDDLDDYDDDDDDTVSWPLKTVMSIIIRIATTGRWSNVLWMMTDE